MHKIVRIRPCQVARSARQRGMPDLLDTDAYGFAATRMVRVKVSRHGAPLRFQRCYMKPGNLTFPAQWRDVGSEEHDRLMGNYVRRKARGEDMRQDVRADSTGMGVCPKPQAGDGEEVSNLSPVVTEREEKMDELEEIKAWAKPLIMEVSPQPPRVTGTGHPEKNSEPANV